jgi:hypothetical protein
MTRGLVAIRGLVVAGALAMPSTPVAADECERSRDRILEGGDLPHKPQTYQSLYRVCRETLEMSNVKGASILTAGAIAVVPRDEGIAATARTLAQFCTRFPRESIRFVLRKPPARRAAAAVHAPTSCRSIAGTG